MLMLLELMVRILRRIAKMFRRFRRRATTQVVLPQLDRTLFNLLKFDQDNLNHLLSSEPRLGHMIEFARKRIQEHTEVLLQVLEGTLTVEQEAALFETVNEDWRLCQEIAELCGSLTDEEIAKLVEEVNNIN